MTIQQANTSFFDTLRERIIKMMFSIGEDGCSGVKTDAFDEFMLALKTEDKRPWIRAITYSRSQFAH